MIRLVNGVYRHFHQYFSYIVAVSFIGGGNQSTRRKPVVFEGNKLGEYLGYQGQFQILRS
jgi:hypothetical protein